MGSEIRDCNFERDTGFGNLTKRDSGNVILKSRDPGNPWTKSSCRLQECRKLASKTYPRPSHVAIVTPMAIYCLFCDSLSGTVMINFSFLTMVLDDCVRREGNVNEKVIITIVAMN